MAMEKHGEVKPGVTPELMPPPMTLGERITNDIKVAEDKRFLDAVNSLSSQDPKKRLADGVAEVPATEVPPT